MTQDAGRKRGRYRYAAFGIEIASDIMLPEFCIGTRRRADVRIIIGRVPREIVAAYEKDAYYEVANQEFLLRLEGVAQYYVANGERIVIEPCDHAEVRELRLYLLGTVMGVLLMQRGILAIHGSALVIDGHGVIFSGVSGAGKSTMAAALLKKGHALLADDITAVSASKEGRLWVQSSYPQQKLWQTGAALVGINTKPLVRLSQDLDKYAVPVHAGFYRQPVPLAAIYEIRVGPADHIKINLLKGADKLAVLLNQTYRGELLEGLGLKTVHFNKCVDMTRHLSVFRLTRPAYMSSLDKQVHMFEDHFGQLWGRNGRCMDDILDNGGR